MYIKNANFGGGAKLNSKIRTLHTHQTDSRGFRVIALWVGLGDKLLPSNELVYSASLLVLQNTRTASENRRHGAHPALDQDETNTQGAT